MYKLISVVTISIIMASIFVAGSNAGELYLCVDETRQTITKMSAPGECLEGEREMGMIGIENIDVNSIVPVANFSPLENCKTGGSRVEIGFDLNGDGQLDMDSNEIKTITEICPHPEDEDSQ